MKPLITVIVPLYNAEKFVDRCVESLQKQTYKNFKIILVNDGSTDRTGELCTKYANIDSRIKYVEQENQGEGGARNAGLRLLNTPYVCFLDCDDTYPIDTIETYISKLEQADLIIGGIEKKDGKNKDIFMPRYQVVDSQEDISRVIIDEQYYLNIVHNKLFKSNVILNNNIFFKKFKYGEDTEFVYSYLQHITSIMFLDQIVLSINVVEGSMSLRKVPDVWECMRSVYEQGRKIDPYNSDFSAKLLMRTVKTSLLVKARESYDEFENVCMAIKKYKQDNKLRLNNNGIYNRLISILFNIDLYHVIYGIMKFRIFTRI